MCLQHVEWRSGTRPGENSNVSHVILSEWVGINMDKLTMTVIRFHGNMLNLSLWPFSFFFFMGGRWVLVLFCEPECICGIATDSLLTFVTTRCKFHQLARPRPLLVRKQVTTTTQQGGACGVYTTVCMLPCVEWLTDRELMGTNAIS